MLTEAQKRATKKYHNEKTKQVNIRLLNNEYSLLQEYAIKNGQTTNGIIRDRIKDIIHPNNDGLTEDHINPTDLTEDHIISSPGNAENS